MLLKIRCWIVQMLLPKELRVYFQLFLIEKLKEMEQELEDIAYGKSEDRGMIRTFIVSIDNSLRNAEQDIDELEMKWGAEELPKHGRLIDADREINKIKTIVRMVQERNPNANLDVYEGEVACLKLADTIIPADKEKE